MVTFTDIIDVIFVEFATWTFLGIIGISVLVIKHGKQPNWTVARMVENPYAR